MYDFVDTDQINTQKNIGPESVKINGTYIEDMVSGYLTLYTSGRELLECEVDDQTIGNRDGSDYRSKRYPPRTITVGYQLCTSSAEKFREAYNQLNKILNVEQAQLIFADEPDKYFIGTKTSNTSVESGRNCVTGEIEFYCADPFKYSLNEKSFKASKNTSTGILETTITNNGSIPVAVSYDVLHNHENGYVAMVSAYGAMQFGSREEPDREVREKSELLLNLSDGSAINKKLTVSTGILTDTKYIKNGTFRTMNYTDGNKQSFYCLTADSSGSGSGQWHGACGQITLPVRSDGTTGSKNFKVDARILWKLVYAWETGVIQVNVGDQNGKLLASLNLYKLERSMYKSVIRMCLGENATVKNEIWFMPEDWNKQPYMYHSENGGGHEYILKNNDWFEFCFAGQKFQYRVPELADKKAATVTIWIGQWSDYGEMRMINQIGIRELTVRSDNVSYIYDIPNRYQQGDKLTIDGPRTKAYVNGIPNLGDEITGSKYFKVPPGDTKVQFFYSDFSDPEPTVTARIREAYL